MANSDAGTRGRVRKKPKRNTFRGLSCFAAIPAQARPPPLPVLISVPDLPASFNPYAPAPRGGLQPLARCRRQNGCAVKAKLPLHALLWAVLSLSPALPSWAVVTESGLRPFLEEHCYD